MNAKTVRDAPIPVVMVFTKPMPSMFDSQGLLPAGDYECKMGSYAFRACQVVAEGEGIFNGTADELRQAVESGGGQSGDLETSFLAFLREHGH